jgi:hypothetical protein
VPIQVTIDQLTYSRLVGYWQSLSRTFKIPVECVGNCKALGKVPEEISFTGLELLLAIGRACTRPQLPFDPARLFALFRYAGVISQSSGQLSLDLVLRTTDSHKLAVLSDEFACGMSFLVAQKTFGATYFLDFETAVYYKWVSTTATKRQRPDFIGQPFDRSFRLFLLEAKGTQDSHSYCKNAQIPKGCAQVGNVLLANDLYSIEKRAVVGLALNYELDSASSRVYIGDPPGGRGHEYKFVTQNKTFVPDSHYLRIASLIGDRELAAALGGQELGKKSPRPEPQTLDVLEVNARMCVGSLVVYESQGAQLRVFVGLDGGLRHRLLMRGSALGDAHLPKERATKGRNNGMALAEDGSVLQFEIVRSQT